MRQHSAENEGIEREYLIYLRIASAWPQPPKIVGCMDMRIANLGLKW
jgi:hypothetical protein